MAFTISRPTNGIDRLGAVKVTIDANTVTQIIPIVDFAYTKANAAVASLVIEISVRTNRLSQTINVAAQAVGATNSYEITFPTLSDVNFPASAVVGSDYASGTLNSTGVNITGAGSGKIKIVVVKNKSTTSAVDLTYTLNGKTFVEPIPPGKQVIIILDNTPTTSSINLKDAGNTTNLDYFTLTLPDTAKNTDSVTVTITEKDAYGNTVDTGSISETFYWLNIAYSRTSGSGFLGYKVSS